LPPFTKTTYKMHIEIICLRHIELHVNNSVSHNHKALPLIPAFVYMNVVWCATTISNTPSKNIQTNIFQIYITCQEWDIVYFPVNVELVHTCFRRTSGTSWWRLTRARPCRSSTSRCVLKVNVNRFILVP